MDTEREHFVDDAIRSLRGISALRPVQGLLRGKGLRSVRSWGDVSERLSAALDDEIIKRSDVVELVTDLRSRFHKYISIYRLSAEQHALAWARAGELADVEDAAFPFLLPDDVIEGLPIQPRHVRTRVSDAGAEFFMVSARLGKRTEAIPPSFLTPEAQSSFEGYEMFAEKVEARQAFDVIFVPREPGPLQVRIDYLATFGRERADTARTAVELLAADLDLLPAGGVLSPVNLFPAIMSFYETVEVGPLTELMFECSTGTDRRERLRRSSSEIDLRQEPYHVAGIAKTAITPYWLAVLANTDHGQVEVMLPGTVRALNKAQVGLDYFQIADCKSEEALASVVQMILEHAGDG